MVTPKARKEAANYLVEVCSLSKRRACRLVGVKRSVLGYRRRPDRNVRVKARMLELAHQKPRYGYRRLYLLLKREGFSINRKRVERLYCEENLCLRRKKPKKHKISLRVVKPRAITRNEAWSMDFVSDSLNNGRRFRALTIIDNHTRESPMIEVGFNLTGHHISRALSMLAQKHGKPKFITVDNGPEFISKALNAWAHENEVKLDFIDKGKPTQNAFIESFNGRFRDECLNQTIFFTINDAKGKIEAWRKEYNQERPHSSLKDMTPNEFANQEKSCRQRTNAIVQF